MPSLGERFATLRGRNEKALVLFVTAGDQPLAELPLLLETLSDAGADVIEVGIPFSDPFGEGPTIQASSQRALDAGATPEGILKAMSRWEPKVPLLTMGYYNPILRFGLQEFADASVRSGSSATIVSDLVPGEADEWREACRRAGLDTVFLAAPTSSPNRIDAVARHSTGFVY